MEGLCSRLPEVRYK